ncbi:MAG: hypothetical protein WAV31_05750 [Candidatus Moraniibacteriota bacterium]
MSKEFSTKEKIYNKILLLQADDEFMADVFVLRKKIEETQLEIIRISEIL